MHKQIALSDSLCAHKPFTSCGPVRHLKILLSGCNLLTPVHWTDFVSRSLLAKCPGPGDRRALCGRNLWSLYYERILWTPKRLVTGIWNAISSNSHHTHQSVKRIGSILKSMFFHCNVRPEDNRPKRPSLQQLVKPFRKSFKMFPTFRLSSLQTWKVICLDPKLFIDLR